MKIGLVILGLAVGQSALAARDIIPSNYRKALIPVEQPMVLNYSFGERDGNAIRLKLVNYPGGISDLFFFHMHVNEETAKKAGLQRVREKGGTFLYLEHGTQNRNMKVDIGTHSYEFDPNRIFTKEALLEKTIPRPTAADFSKLLDFVSWIKENIQIARQQRARPMVIALHNNTDDDAYGELLSILTEKKLLGLDNEKVSQNQSWDIDNFYIATLPTTFNKLTEDEALNISLRMKNPRNIGYISNWMIQEKIDYLNVETQHADLKSNLEMIALLQNQF